MNIFASFRPLFGILGYFFSHGGWIVFVFVGIYLLWLLMWIYHENKYYTSVKWVHLAIDIPKENEQTFLAVEQIFAQMHSIHVKKTFGEKYFHGEFMLWLSFEIVSFGGQIKYIARVPEKFRNLVESAIYAQYPQAEIKEVEDYIKNVPGYNPDTSYYDLWGTEFLLKKQDAYPIRTYRAFEHQASQIIVDPLAAVLESLSSIQPNELMAVQYLFRPTDDAWKESGYKLVKKLKGQKEESRKQGFIGSIADGVLGGFADMAGGGGAPAEKKPEGKSEPSLMMHLTPGEKDVIAAIELNLSKIGWQTKIRLLYLAPKEKFRGDAKAGIVGAFRQFDDISLNGLKPDTKHTWTAVTFKFSKTLEGPYMQWVANRRKRHLLHNFKTRIFSLGQKPFVLNIEEIATVFHFPILTVKAPQMTMTESRKAEAPINLPVQL